MSSLVEGIFDRKLLHRTIRPGTINYSIELISIAIPYLPDVPFFRNAFEHVLINNLFEDSGR